MKSGELDIDQEGRSIVVRHDGDFLSKFDDLLGYANRVQFLPGSGHECNIIMKTPLGTDLQCSGMNDHGTREVDTLLCSIDDGDILDTILVKRERSRHASRSGAND